MDIIVSDLSKSYHLKDLEYVVLKGINSEFYKGTLTCVIGYSGSGKSTFFKIIAGLILKNMGSVMYGYEELKELDILRVFRKKNIGYLGQYPEDQLFLDLTIKDNLNFLLKKYGYSRGERNTKMKQLMRYVGIDYLSLDDKCKILSGGELQRLALASTLAKDPSIILADEPTGNVDFRTAKIIIQLLKDLAKKQGKTVIIASHDTMVQRYADVTYRLTDGRISEELRKGVSVDNKGLIPLRITKGGTITLPESVMESLPPVSMVYLEKKGNDVVIHFGGKKNE